MEEIVCDIVPYYEVAEAELDEMWSYVFSKENQRWLWVALDHQNRQILAYAFVTVLPEEEPEQEANFAPGLACV